MTGLARGGVDLLVGDPPNRWHPVAWIGRLITLARGRAPRAPDDLALYGTFLILIVAGLAAGAALVAQALLGELPGPAAPLAQAWLLKCSFSLSGLFAAVEIVRGHLVAGDLDGARRQVAWHLVSRDTTGLDEGAVASAASSPSREHHDGSRRPCASTWPARSSRCRGRAGAGVGLPRGEIPPTP